MPTSQTSRNQASTKQSSRTSGSYSFLLTPRWLTYIAVAILAALVCGVLSNWQNHRREQRDAEIARIEANYAGPTTALTALVPDTDSPLHEDDEWKRVSLTGTYDTEDTVLARNRTNAGSAGYYVVVPFEVTSGDAAGTSIAVARGWIPTDSEGGTPAPDTIPAPPDGTTTVSLWVRPAQDGSKDDNPEGLIRAIDPTRIPGLADGYQHVYGELEAEDPAPAAALTPLPAPDTSPGSHLSYTFQWIVFGIMILGGVALAARRENRARVEEAAREEARIAAGGETPVQEYVVVDKAALGRGVGTKAGRYGGTSPARVQRVASDASGEHSGRSAQDRARGRRKASYDEDAFLDEQL